MKRLSPGLSFALLCGISLALWFRPLLDTFWLAASDEKYTHILLILPLAVMLISRDWRHRTVDAQICRPAGAFLLISLAALAARWSGMGDISLAIEMLALVTWWIASFALCFGLPTFRSFRFPLLFLFWLVPIPKVVMDPVISGLQQGSVRAAQLLFLLFRVPVSRDGIALLIPGLEIDVTTECSSIRSSLMLLVTTSVVAYLLLKKPWRRDLVIAVAIPLSVAKNGLRVFTLGMLGTRVDESYLTGRLHHQGGVVFFLIALAMIFLLVWILLRGESGSRARVSAQEKFEPAPK